MPERPTQPSGGESGRPGDRDSRGKFLPGHRVVGKGNPAGNHQERFRHRALRATSDDEFDDAWAALKQEAKNGSIEHLKLFFAYTMGKPVEEINITDNRAQVIIELLNRSEDALRGEFEERWKRLNALEQPDETPPAAALPARPMDVSQDGDRDRQGAKVGRVSKKAP